MLFVVPHPLLVVAVGITIFVILSPFIFAEKFARRRRVAQIKKGDWLADTEMRTKYSKAETEAFQKTSLRLSKQDSFDTAARLISRLKAAFAECESVRLVTLTNLLSDPKIFSEQLWQDMALGLAGVHRSYDLEMHAYITVIADESQNALISHAGQMLALSGKRINPRLKGLAETFSGSLIWRTLYNFGQNN